MTTTCERCGQVRLRGYRGPHYLQLPAEEQKRTGWTYPDGDQLEVCFPDGWGTRTAENRDGQLLEPVKERE